MRRLLVLSVWLAAIVLRTMMLAQNASVYGVYNGTYVCTQESTNFKLTLTPAGDGGLTGVFTFYPTRLAPKSFTFTLYGLLNGGSFQLQPTNGLMPANAALNPWYVSEPTADASEPPRIATTFPSLPA